MIKKRELKDGCEERRLKCETEIQKRITIKWIREDNKSKMDEQKIRRKGRSKTEIKKKKKDLK